MEKELEDGAGWASGFGTEENKPTYTDKGLGILQAYTRLFNTVDGKVVLEHLRSVTVDKPTYPSVVTDGTIATQLQNQREGQNQLYRAIISTIKKGENL